MRPADSPSRSTSRSSAASAGGRQSRPGTRARRCAGIAIAGAMVAPVLAACGQGGSGSVNGVPVVNWYIGAQAGGWIEDAIATCNTQNKGKFVIKEQELPSRATDQREQIVRRLAANDSSVDLIGMDVIWTAEFANAGWLYAVPRPMPSAKLSERRAQGPAGERAPIRASSTARRTPRTRSCSGTARASSQRPARLHLGPDGRHRPSPST